MKILETIVQVGAVGGTITLSGIEVDGEWYFSLETDESTL